MLAEKKKAEKEKKEAEEAALAEQKKAEKEAAKKKPAASNATVVAPAVAPAAPAPAKLRVARWPIDGKVFTKIDSFQRNKNDNVWQIYSWFVFEYDKTYSFIRPNIIHSLEVRFGC